MEKWRAGERLRFPIGGSGARHVERFLRRCGPGRGKKGGDTFSEFCFSDRGDSLGSPKSQISTVGSVCVNVDKAGEEVELTASVHDDLTAAWWVVSFVDLVDTPFVVDFEADRTDQGL